MNEIARRPVLQTSSQENGRTGIPMAVPPSAMKRSTQNKRLSVAGPAARGIYPPAGLAPPSTNPRQSLYRSQNLNPLLASASKHGRTPLQSLRFSFAVRAARTNYLAIGACEEARYGVVVLAHFSQLLFRPSRTLVLSAIVNTKPRCDKISSVGFRALSTTYPCRLWRILRERSIEI